MREYLSSILSVIWTSQYKFFRQYGLQDGPTLRLNAGLLFVVLFFTYPLKFLFTWLTALFAGREMLVRLADGKLVPMVPDGKQAELMVVYGLGYLAVFAMLFLLHLHMQEQLLQVAIAFISLGFAFRGAAGFAGMTYVLIWPAVTINGWLMGRRERKLFGR